MSHRLEQIDEVIRHEVAGLLLTEVEFPGHCLVTIVRVKTSKDLRHSRIWLSVMPAYYSAKVLAIVKSQAGHLQYLLNQKLSLKPLPRIAFAIDETEKKAADIDALLDQIKKTL